MEKWVFALLAALVLAACTPQEITCATPYMQNGNTCCLDKDSNAICDVDEGRFDEQEEVSCDLCPPTFVTQTEELIIYKYVCPDQTIVDDASLCSEEITTSNANQFTLSEQEAAEVTAFSARPACRGAYPVAELHLEVNQSPAGITLQARGPSGGYEDVWTSDPNIIGNIDDEYIYIGFCNANNCGELTDAQLASNTAHAVRIKLRYAEADKNTRELLLDPTTTGEYGTKKC